MLADVTGDDRDQLMKQRQLVQDDEPHVFERMTKADLLNKFKVPDDASRSLFDVVESTVGTKYLSAPGMKDNVRVVTLSGPGVDVPQQDLPLPAAPPGPITLPSSYV